MGMPGIREGMDRIGQSEPLAAAAPPTVRALLETLGLR
jgi:hypothetical protein